MNTRDTFSVETLAHDEAMTLEQVCRICHIEPERLRQYIEFDIVTVETEPETANRTTGGQRLAVHQLLRVRRAWRLQRDLDIDTAGVALALDLLEKIDRLENELARLHRRLGQ